MSWSIQLGEKPENIITALDEQSNKLEGKSKEEYDEALPHIKALINMNYNKSELSQLGMKVTASGHAYDGYSNCTVSIGYLDVILV